MSVSVRFSFRVGILRIFMSAGGEKVYYAVGRGRETGIYDTWSECKAQTEGFANSKYRKFYSLEDAKEFVNFWKSYSSPEPKSPEFGNLGEAEGKETNEPDKSSPAQSTKQAPTASQRHGGSLQAPPSPHSVPFEGRPSQANVEMLALSLRLDSFERRFDACLKEFGAITSEIAHLRSDIKELKESLKSAAKSGAANTPKKPKDGLLQTTLNFTSGSAINSARSFSSRRSSSDSDEPHRKKVKTLKRRLSRSNSSERRSANDSMDELVSNLKPEEVDLASFRLDEEDFVEVYTDGSALNNGQSGAKAGIGIWFGHDHPLNVAEAVVGPPTNNTAEIQAARVAVQLAIKCGIKKLRIFTDSEFLINCATKWISRWKRNGWTVREGGPVKNRKELEKLDKFASQIAVRWEKVPGHSKVEGNEMADRLANEGAAKYKR